jgi:hypothetical protein
MEEGQDMKALVYHGPGKRSWEEKPKPVIQDSSDAIVRILRTTICGSDLHILKGHVPSATDGRILGHEGLGIVEEAGPSVSSFKRGERVLISCISSCGKCTACKKGMYSHCGSGGKAVEQIMELTGQRGVDVAIEAVGLPASFGICQDIVAAGGHLANIGVHGSGVTLKLDRLWDRNLTLTTRLVDTVTLPMLMKSVLSGRLQPKKLITHDFHLDEMIIAALGLVVSVQSWRFGRLVARDAERLFALRGAGSPIQHLEALPPPCVAMPSLWARRHTRPCARCACGTPAPSAQRSIGLQSRFEASSISPPTCRASSGGGASRWRPGFGSWGAVGS